MVLRCIRESAKLDDSNVVLLKLVAVDGRREFYSRDQSFLQKHKQTSHNYLETVDFLKNAAITGKRISMYIAKSNTHTRNYSESL